MSLPLLLLFSRPAIRTKRNCIIWVICLFCWIVTYCNIASTAATKAFWDCSKGSYQSQSNLSNQPLAGTLCQRLPTTSNHNHPSSPIPDDVWFMCLWPKLKIGIIVACPITTDCICRVPSSIQFERWKSMEIVKPAAICCRSSTGAKGGSTISMS